MCPYLWLFTSSMFRMPSEVYSTEINLVVVGFRHLHHLARTPGRGAPLLECHSMYYRRLHDARLGRRPAPFCTFCPPLSVEDALLPFAVFLVLFEPVFFHFSLSAEGGKDSSTTGGPSRMRCLRSEEEAHVHHCCTPPSTNSVTCPCTAGYWLSERLFHDLAVLR